MTEHGICAKCKKSVGCSYADDRITGCKKFVLEPELELTNEERLRSCSFNELARVLYCMIINGERIRPDLGYIKRWLKEIHDEM